MSRYYSYLNTSKDILQVYKGDQPFAYFIKEFFRQDKKYGSSDRKSISDLCYCYFRLGKALPVLSIEERIKAGLFLCSSFENELLEQLAPEWNAKADLSFEEKCSIINSSLSSLNAFPWKEELSEGTDHEQFNKSFFIQPDLFLRLRPGHELRVKQRLIRAGISFTEMNAGCLLLPNASKIETVIELNKEAVVQDYSSQRVGEFIKSEIRNEKSEIRNTKAEISKVWDCCAASGGKSIMAKDILGNIDLTVSDIRESILINLKKRFAEAGIKKYNSFVADLTHSPFTNNHSPFDLIIVDAPCTGSGAWSRTPEQLFYFNDQSIRQYSNLQKKIVSNAIPHLVKNGLLLYSTCSVFRKENEEVVEFIQEKFNLRVLKMELLKGYDKKADSMFAALFTTVSL